jgi:hydrogenase maturation protein HypF
VRDGAAFLSPHLGDLPSEPAYAAFRADLDLYLAMLDVDAIAALLGVREEVSYEGQATVELEQLAGDTVAAPYPWRLDDVGALIRAVVDDRDNGRPAEEIAAAFHESVAAAAVAACAEAGEPRTVVLSGGSFQNLRLLEATRIGLEAAGFRVLEHRLVPPNDGGISYGQPAIAAARP